MRFYDSRLLGHAAYSSLMQQFNVTKDLNPNHMYQISVDGPNVYLKFCDYCKKREENKQYVLADVGTGGHHTIHIAFKYDGILYKNMMI